MAPVFGPHKFAKTMGVTSMVRQLVIGLAIMATMSGAEADVTYTYTGNQFLYIGGCCGVSKVSGFFSVPSALTPNTTYSNLANTLTNYSFTDGRYTWVPSNYPGGPTPPFNITNQFAVKTDSLGHIADWQINIVSNNPTGEINTQSASYAGPGGLLDGVNVYNNYVAYSYAPGNPNGQQGVSGTWTASVQPMIATAVQDIGRPFSVAVHNGFAYVADPTAHTVWRVELSTRAKAAAAGTGVQGFNGDGIDPKLAQLDNPTGVAVDPKSGALYIADSGNHAIRKVAAPGVAGALITTVAGIPTAYGVGESTLAACANPPAGFNMSQCVAATKLRLFGPRAVAVDGNGNVYIADRMNQQIKKLDNATGFLFAVAGVAGFPGADNGSTADCTRECFPARFNSPVGVTVDDAGNVYVADEGNNAIRMISRGFVSTLTVPPGSLLRPTGVAPLSSGGPSLYVADYGHNRIQLLNCGDGCRLRSVAGNGEAGFSGDGGPATAAQLNSPMSVALDGNLLYIADLLNGRVRKVDFTPAPIIP